MPLILRQISGACGGAATFKSQAIYYIEDLQSVPLKRSLAIKSRAGVPDVFGCDI